MDEMDDTKSSANATDAQGGVSPTVPDGIWQNLEVGPAFDALYKNKCAACGGEIGQGARARFVSSRDRKKKAVVHSDCVPPKWRPARESTRLADLM